MTKDDLFEEIRTLVREPLAATVERPWEYTDKDLVPQVRSALRHLSVLGVTVGASMDSAGTLSGTLSDRVGVLIALRVVSQLLRGDLLKKVLDGDMGTYFRSGPDALDTRDAVPALEKVASGYDREYRSLLNLVISSNPDAIASVFTSQGLE